MIKYNKRQVKGQEKLINYRDKYAKDLTFLDHYVNSETKLKAKDRYGNIYKLSPHEFKRGYRPYTYLMTKKLIKILPKGYVLKGKYKNANTKVAIQCSHGHIFYLTLQEIERKLKNNVYPICTICAEKRNHEHVVQQGKYHFLKYFNKYLRPLGWKIMSPYKTAFTKTSFICPKGHHIKMMPAVIKQGHRCKFCQRKSSKVLRGKHLAKTERMKGSKSFHRYYKKYLYPLGWRQLSKYVRSRDSIKFKTPMSNIVHMSPKCLKSGFRPRQDRSKKRFLKYFNKHLKPLGYVIASNFKGSHRKIELICSNGHTFNTTPHSAEAGQRCPICSHKQSAGELMVLKVFKAITDQTNIPFEWEYANTTLLTPLHLDFVIYTKHQVIGMEIDGKQHFQPVGVFGGIKAVCEEGQRDTRKNIRCLKKHIPLIRVRYPSKDYFYLTKALKWLFNKLIKHQWIPQGIHYFY